MDYGMISKIEKAKIYSEERERIQFENLRVSIKGDNNKAPHVVEYNNGLWKCDCDFFASRNVCSHTMAIERILRDMVELGEAV
ncbi:MAG: hypothetical protein H6659_05395 [Ardenticatenaceae bacterium]|nr:hypothetical protein [Anaerolineales bacterium]MCB8983233.1 hypothetical protein [Ardenticatenaceae bacterium]MCB8987518.1 hypothetical protein [Ardenticatenaceae bacterium]